MDFWEGTGETVTVSFQDQALSSLPRTHAKGTGKMTCVWNLNPREVKKVGPLGLTGQPAWLSGWVLYQWQVPSAKKWWPVAFAYRCICMQVNSGTHICEPTHEHTQLINTLLSGRFHVKRSNHAAVKFLGSEEQSVHCLPQPPTMELNHCKEV